ncbi:MAG: hypothetical protein IAF58_06840 [Leptolyngbya sp.]|nr:hypothetical protein [Candidatus Melainabacteria bacterium]
MSEQKIQMDPRFLRLKGFATRLEAMGEDGIKFIQSPKLVVAGEALLACGLARQAGEVIETACQNLGFRAAALAQELPEDESEIAEIVSQLATAAKAMAATLMRTSGINAEAAEKYMPAFVDELSDVAEDLLKRAEKHFAAARVADLEALPQADGDDGQTSETSAAE